MPSLLQINSCVNLKSTGRIVEGIGEIAVGSGWKSYIAYGRESAPGKSRLVKIGNKLSVISHVAITRLLDMHGYGSWVATKRFLRQVDKIKPDIVHLHNIHGYYINIDVLFDYLSKENIPIVWTLHDCWPITGHCAHFDQIGCEKWKTECHHCPQKGGYPASLLADRSRKNYRLKKELFTSVKNMTIVPVSEWLSLIVKDSYLSKYPIHIINNGIDLNVFSPQTENKYIREEYQIGDAFMILGVATAWGINKGLNDFIEMSKDTQWKVVLIGIPESIRKRLPSNIITLCKTENQNELASFYSAADVFVNPTYLDSFPTVNLEALACGTPVITYKTGGSPEAIDSKTGLVIEKGDLDALISSIKQVKAKGKEFYSMACVERAKALYNKDDRYKEYIDLYESIIKTGR